MSLGRRAGGGDLARPVAERRVGIVEDPQQAVALCEVGRLAQQGLPCPLATAVQRERPQPQQLDVQPPLAGLLRQRVGAGQRFERAAPFLGRDRRVTVRQLALQRDAAPPQRPLRQRGVGQASVDARGELAAGLGPEAAGMQA
jgi:hypothetical protein